MKTSSLISLACSLVINGFNTFHQPAAAGQVTQSLHIAEALSREDVDTSNDLVAKQVADKYGDRDAEGRMEIAPCCDNVSEFFDGLAAVSIDAR
jgi:hypothetical protein